MLLHLRELGLLCRTRVVFFDTGWEHSDTYSHLDYLEGAIGITIERLGAVVDLAEHLVTEAEAIEHAMGRATPSAFVRLCLKKGIFPRRTVRFCTQILKVFVAGEAIRTMHLDGGDPPVNVIGIRAAESAARSKLGETELSTTLDCLVWRPLIAWSEEQVLDIHRAHGVRLNPLYFRGAERVGCWPCIYGSKAELRALASDKQRVGAIRLLEAAVQRGHLSRAEKQGKTVERAPTLFTSARKNDAGERPGILIDEALAWARTSRGGALNQEWLFESDPADPDAGCMRWGMCEHPEEKE